MGPLSIAQHLGKLGYDPQRDLAPLSMGVVFPNVLVVPSSLGVKTLAEFIALARKQPGKVTYASTGNGSASHLAGELFKQVGQIEGVDSHLLALAKTNLQQGFMWFVRSIAKPADPFN